MDNPSIIITDMGNGKISVQRINLTSINKFLGMLEIAKIEVYETLISKQQEEPNRTEVPSSEK